MKCHRFLLMNPLPYRSVSLSFTARQATTWACSILLHASLNNSACDGVVSMFSLLCVGMTWLLRSKRLRTPKADRVRCAGPADMEEALLNAKPPRGSSRRLLSSIILLCRQIFIPLSARCSGRTWSRSPTQWKSTGRCLGCSSSCNLL